MAKIVSEGANLHYLETSFVQHNQASSQSVQPEMREWNHLQTVPNIF